MKHYARILACLVALALLLSPTGILAEGGSVGDPNLNPPGEFPICKQTVLLKIGLAQNPNVEDFETCFQTLYIEEKGNFDLSFETFPSAEYAQQLTLMVAAGGDDLPDVILGGLTDTRVYQYALAGAIINLNDYAANSSYFLNEAKERTGVDFMPMVTSPDGNIYALPSYNQSLGNEYPAKMWIYKPWLDQLNLKIPTTTDELYEVLKAFKTQDPNGNGLADEIPLVDRKDGYMIKGLVVPFQFRQDNGWFVVEDGKVYLAYTTEGFQEALHYIRKLVAEELISPLSFTQDQQQFNAMVSNEETIVGMIIAMSVSGPLGASDQRRAEYVGIPPLLANDGSGNNYALFAPSVANPAGAISKNCKTPEAAFRLLDFMISEDISIMQRWGEKGVDWLLPEEGAQSMYAALGYAPTLKPVSPWGHPQNKWWAQVGPMVRQYSIAAGMVWDGDELNSEYLISKIAGEYMGHRPDAYIPKFVFTEEEEMAISEIATTSNDFVTESIARFAVGDLDVDRDWDQFQRDLQSYGIDAMLEVYQKVYDRMYK